MVFRSIAEPAGTGPLRRSLSKKEKSTASPKEPAIKTAEAGNVAV
jgi:hypothetical protein